MKIAIHSKVGSFSEHWIDYCNANDINYKIVDCYKSDIVSQLKDCEILMWHHHHANYKDVLFAKELIYSLEASGKKTFPNANTCWHFDDKIGQKYLLESIDAPLVPSYVFYSRDEALKWIENVSFPKVFKLRSGASGSNVKLVKTKDDAKKLNRRAFGSGFNNFNRIEYFKEQIRKIKTGNQAVFLGYLKGIHRLLFKTEFSKYSGKEVGYIYFQDFIPKNEYDVRLIIIGDKAYGMKRKVRKGDFRASGSHEYLYEKIDENTLKLAFEVAKKLNLQAVAFDFIYTENKDPLIVEMSYSFGTEGSSKCPGYWNSELKYFEKPFNPFGWMVEMVLK